VSIWKDVSELPERKRNFLVRTNRFGDVFCWFDFQEKAFVTQIDDEPRGILVPNYEILSWTELSNFINSFEQMQKDIEELKRSNK